MCLTFGCAKQRVVVVGALYLECCVDVADECSNVELELEPNVQRTTIQINAVSF